MRKVFCRVCGEELSRFGSLGLLHIWGPTDHKAQPDNEDEEDAPCLDELANSEYQS